MLRGKQSCIVRPHIIAMYVARIMKTSRSGHSASYVRFRFWLELESIRLASFQDESDPLQPIF